MRKFKRTFNKLLLVICFIGISSCCSDKNTTSVIDDFWNHTILEMVKCNLMVDSEIIDEELHCVSKSGIVKLENLTGEFRLRGLSGVYSGNNFKNTISPDYSVFLQEFSNETLLVTQNSSENNGGSLFYPSRIDEAFAEFDLLGIGGYKESVAIDANNRLMTVYTGKNENQQKTIIVICDLTNGTQFDTSVNFGNIRYWELPESQGKTVILESIFAYDDDFYISYSIVGVKNAHMKITSSDELIEYPSPFGSIYNLSYAFFKYQDKLWSQINTRELAFTEDGENWNIAGALTVYIYDYIEIGDYLFIYLNDKIYALGYLDSQLKLYELPCDNLRGNVITSIRYWQDNIVITTMNGFYYISYSKALENMELSKMN